MKKHHLHILLYLSFVLSAFTSCDNRKCCITDECYSYQFKLPINIHPLQDTFRMGDTITHTSVFSDEIEDLRDGQTYKLENIEWLSATSIHRVDTFPIEDVVKNGFIEYWVEADNVQQSSGNINFTFIAFIHTYEKSTYSYQMKFVVRKPGLYVISTGTIVDGGNSSYTPKGFPGDCKWRSKASQFYMNDRTDNNYGMQQNSLDPYWKNRTQEELDQVGAYFFVVVP